MNQQTALSAYKNALYDNAPPLKIVHMMYEGALRFLAQAEQLDPKTDPQPFSESLRRADRIVNELRMSLDHDQAPELCADLNRLYLFSERQIQDALLGQSVDPIGEARTVLETLLEGWRLIEVPESLAG